jgi:hypothetical protein
MAIGIGTKVRCIDDSIKPEALFGVIEHFPNWVKKGESYTVRELLNNDDIVDGLLLEEISNPAIFITLLNRKQEPAFALWRFAEEEIQEEEYSIEEIMSEELIEILQNPIER